MPIYVPNYDLMNDICVVVLDENTIRSYSVYPQIGLETPYTDYYFNSSYISRPDIITWTAQNYEVPNCIAHENLTNDMMYRNDIDGIMITFSVYAFIVVALPLMLFKQLFKRRY